MDGVNFDATNETNQMSEINVFFDINETIEWPIQGNACISEEAVIAW